MRNAKIWIASAVLAVAAVLAVLSLVPSSSTAQQAPPPSVSVASGPGGMWVVYGNKVTVCAQLTPPIAGQPPPAPRCGPATTLP